MDTVDVKIVVTSATSNDLIYRIFVEQRAIFHDFRYDSLRCGSAHGCWWLTCQNFAQTMTTVRWFPPQQLMLKALRQRICLLSCSKSGSAALDSLPVKVQTFTIPVVVRPKTTSSGNKLCQWNRHHQMSFLFEKNLLFENNMLSPLRFAGRNTCKALIQSGEIWDDNVKRISRLNGSMIKTSA